MFGKTEGVTLSSPVLLPAKQIDTVWKNIAQMVCDKSLFIHIYSNLGISLTSWNLQFHPISLRWSKIGPKANSHPRVTMAMFNAAPTKIASNGILFDDNSKSETYQGVKR